MPPYYLGGVYLPVHIPTYTTLGIPWCIHCTSGPTGVQHRVVTMRGDGALGSEEKKPVGERPLRVLMLSFLLRFVGNDAQNALLSPGRIG